MLTASPPLAQELVVKRRRLGTTRNCCISPAFGSEIEPANAYFDY